MMITEAYAYRKALNRCKPAGGEGRKDKRDFRLPTQAAKGISLMFIPSPGYRLKYFLVVYIRIEFIQASKRQIYFFKSRSALPSNPKHFYFQDPNAFWKNTSFPVYLLS